MQIVHILCIHIYFSILYRLKLNVNGMHIMQLNFYVLFYILEFIVLLSLIVKI